MASSFLFPPNRASLSDQVIGGVVQRLTPLHGRFNVDNSRVEGQNKRRTYEEPRSYKHIQQEDALPRRKMKISAARRERCRINQARYRMRQREHAQQLSDSIQQLNDEIHELQIQQQTILKLTPTGQSVWGVATEYFHLFQRGYDSATSSPQRSRTQLGFLKTTMVSDVTDGDLCGAEQILDNWRLLSLYHDDVEVRLKCLEEDDGGSVTASMTISLTITENTIQHVYPHLVCCVNGVKRLSPLAERLVNQHLKVRGSVRFDWDDATDRVIRLESKFDLLLALIELLGSLEDAAHVLTGALVTAEGRFIVQKNGSTSSMALVTRTEV